MGALAKVLIGGAVVGVAVVVLSGKANASSSGGAPTPGPGATVQNLPAGTKPGLPALKRTSWAVPGDASGAQPGTMLLTQNATNPADWVLVFVDTRGGAGMLAAGTTQLSGLMAQELAAGF